MLNPPRSSAPHDGAHHAIAPDSQIHEAHPSNPPSALLMGGIGSMFRASSSLRRFNRTPRDERQIVFYAESRADWAHLGPIADELTSAGRTISYVTSDEDDPVLSS